MSFAPVTHHVLHASRLKAPQLEAFLDTIPVGAPYVAVSAAYGAERQIEWLAFLHAGQQAIVIHIDSKSASPAQKKRFRRILADFMEAVVREYSIGFIAYDADVLATALFLECGVRLERCHNVQTIRVVEPLNSFGYTKELFKRSGAIFDRSQYRILLDDRSKSPDRLNALLGRAWGALAISAREAKELENSTAIETADLSDEVSL